jgi:hypothetical protein
MKHIDSEGGCNVKEKYSILKALSICGLRLIASIQSKILHVRKTLEKNS